MGKFTTDISSATTSPFDYEYRDFVAKLYRNADDPVLLALGLASEAGEVAGFMEKIANQGHTPDVPKLVKELGDVEFYLNALYAFLDTTGTHIRRENMVKLRKRYPTGEFNVKDSVARKDKKRQVKKKTKKKTPR